MSRRSRTAPTWHRQFLLGGLSAGLSGFAIRREIGPHDEGLMLQAAARIASGQWPYRDFRINYPPGQALVLASVHKAFGPSLLGWRAIRVGVDAYTSVLAYRLTRRCAPESLALTAWLGVAGAMAFPTGPGPNPPAQVLALAALLAAPSHPRRGGALAGLAASFRLEVGAAAAAGVALGASRGRRMRAIGTAAVVALGALGPFAAKAPREMFDDTLGFFRIQRLQRLPFPLRFRGPLRPSKLIEFYAPAILVGGLGAWVLSVAKAPSDARGRELAPAPLAAVGAGYLLARTDEFHLVPLAATLPVMLATAVASERRRGHRLTLLTALVLIVAHGLDRKAGQALHPPALSGVAGRSGRGVKTSPDDADALAELVRAVHGLTAEGEPIFVANPRHDLVRVGNPLLYTILDRPNPTRYDVMQPSVVTTAQVQREIVAALATTRVVIRWVHPTASEPEPNGAGRSSGVEILDRYLASAYREQGRYGHYALLVRNHTGDTAT